MKKLYRTLIFTTFIKLLITIWFVVVNFTKLDTKQYCKFDNFEGYEPWQKVNIIALFIF